jgi:hypothetical protein
MSLIDRMTYARFKLFRSSLAPVSARARRQRFQLFRDLMGLKAGMRILDVGGFADTWLMADVPLKITILNLTGNTQNVPAPRHRITCVQGDGCTMPQFAAGEFDIVFSNSVIEHVGPRDRQEAFAREIRRLGERYWVQTPAKWFPVEAHCGMPFWWFYPESWRRRLINRWRQKLPEWTDVVEGTRVLERSSLATMFPEAEILTETLLAIPKSYIAVAAPRQA